jgi:hypothetical protein
MADIDTRRDPNGRVRDWDRDRDRDRDDDRSPRIITSTETRRSFATTEFRLTILAVAAMIIVGYADDDGLGAGTAWMLSAGVVAAYLLSRGIAKAGSSDPTSRSLDRF